MPRDRVISSEEWERRRGDVEVSTDDLNALVMNWLVTEVRLSPMPDCCCKLLTRHGGSVCTI